MNKETNALELLFGEDKIEDSFLELLEEMPKEDLKAICLNIENLDDKTLFRLRQRLRIIEIWNI